MKRLGFSLLLSLAVFGSVAAQTGSKHVDLKEITDGKFRQVTAIGEMRSLPDGEHDTAMNRRFHPATATVNPDGVGVTVRSEAVPSPVAVRYEWANFTREANLVNSAGLPAAPFRTDEWPLPTDDDL